MLREVVRGSRRLSLTGVLGGKVADEFEGLELLSNGMTYDLVGASPGRSFEVPVPIYRFGLPPDTTIEGSEALCIYPGPHLASGARTVPVVRTMMSVAAMIVAHLPRLQAISWPAARTVIGVDFFVSIMTAWTAGGAFPALGLTAFAADADGSLRSEGLAFFTGQELRIEPALAKDKAAATRLGIRLVNQLVGRGRLESAEAILGPAGERLTLEPVERDRVIGVRRR
ncbi:hypothetical protein GCM10011515_09660 [Tsuneonella deserti]|uniref:Uncharacterized protein n=1 Tax=Tsuneonella deserti TaxID=2035528 RepID=A0ABQ1S744_9SPHN|nr:hypothetical protein [Tsuneonella deserti]GGD92048.1 hypothetical protein GCM10011515_09660 [Tsuneonella deserti]